MRKRYIAVMAAALAIVALCLSPVRFAQAESASFPYEIINGEAYVTGYTGPSGAVEIPPSLGGAPVVSVYLSGTPAYITELTLPETVREIPEGAFLSITSLKTVRGLEYVQTVGSYAFANTAVRSAVFSDALEFVDVYAFGFSILSSVTVPDDIRYTLYPFGSCFLLKEILLVPGSGEATLDLIDGVLFSADNAILMCYPSERNGFSYRVPEGTRILADESFEYIGKSLKELYIPGSVLEISEVTFHNAMSEYTIYTEANSRADILAKGFAGKDLYTHVRDASEFSSDGFLQSILNECIDDSMSAYEKALGIHDWIIENCEYDYAYTDGYQMLLYRKGVCQAYAEAFDLLATQAGLSCRVVGTFDHAFNAVDMGGEWMYVDCTWDDGGGSAMETHRYFGFGQAVRYADYGPDYFDRFNYIIYSDISPLNDSSGKFHYFYRTGLLNGALSECEGKIRGLLNEGRTEFSLSVEASLTNFRDIGGRTLAALLSDRKWSAGGAEISILCAWVDGNLLCVVKDPAVGLEDFQYSISVDGATILAYTGDDANVTVPSTIGGRSVTAIGAGAFLNAVGIRNVSLPEGLITIKGNAFSDCYALEAINFPSTLRSIDATAFFRCFSLKSDIVLPEGLKKIGAQAFQFCKSITNVNCNSKLDSQGRMGSGILGSVNFVQECLK